MKTIDCSYLFENNDDSKYSDIFSGYIKFFEVLATAEGVFSVQNVPRCWIPMIEWIGHTVESSVHKFPEDHVCLSPLEGRQVVEVASTLRPELPLVLQLVDTVWKCPHVDRNFESQFAMTTSGSFNRVEIREYIEETLQYYKPTKEKCVLVPCSADKPYPDAMQREVMKRLPDKSWQVISVTGAVGLVPDDLWGRMPEYDTRIANHWRVMEIVSWYFLKHHYKKIVVYVDLYAYAVHLGLNHIAPDVDEMTTTFCFGEHYRDSYDNLLLPEHLRMLENTLTIIEKDN